MNYDDNDDSGGLLETIVVVCLGLLFGIIIAVGLSALALRQTTCPVCNANIPKNSNPCPDCNASLEWG